MVEIFLFQVHPIMVLPFKLNYQYMKTISKLNQERAKSMETNKDS